MIVLSRSLRESGNMIRTLKRCLYAVQRSQLFYFRNCLPYSVLKFKQLHGHLEISSL